MRGRLGLVQRGWEAEDEMEGRFRGFVGGGEDMVSYSLSIWGIYRFRGWCVGSYGDRSLGVVDLKVEVCIEGSLSKVR